MNRSVRLSALAVAGTLLLSSAAFAAEPPAGEPPATPPAPPSEPQTPPATPATPAPGAQTAERDPLDEIVCKKEEATVGSRLGSRKVCKTRRQWRDERRDATSVDLPDGGLQPGPGVSP